MTDPISTLVADAKPVVAAVAADVAVVKTEVSFVQANWAKISAVVVVLVAAALLLRGCL